MSDVRYTPDELRAQLVLMHPGAYERGINDPGWQLQVGKGAGMLSVAADQIERLEAALRYWMPDYVDEASFGAEQCAHWKADRELLSPTTNSGLTPARCTGCGKRWWIEPPPVAPGHCMCCQGALRFLVASVSNESSTNRKGEPT
jgi:hypothetical protein